MSSLDNYFLWVFPHLSIHFLHRQSEMIIFYQKKSVYFQKICYLKYIHLSHNSLRKIFNPKVFCKFPRKKTEDEYISIFLILRINYQKVLK